MTSEIFQLRNPKGAVTSMANMRNAYNFLCTNLKGRYKLGDVGVDER
jgi:hypothetical protein